MQKGLLYVRRGKEVDFDEGELISNFGNENGGGDGEGHEEGGGRVGGEGGNGRVCGRLRECRALYGNACEVFEEILKKDRRIKGEMGMGEFVED